MKAQTDRSVTIKWARRALERERAAGREPDPRLWGLLDISHGNAPEDELMDACLIVHNIAHSVWVRHPDKYTTTGSLAARAAERAAATVAATLSIRVHLRYASGCAAAAAEAAAGAAESARIDGASHLVGMRQAIDAARALAREAEISAQRADLVDLVPAGSPSPLRADWEWPESGSIRP